MTDRPRFRPGGTGATLPSVLPLLLAVILAVATVPLGPSPAAAVDPSPTPVPTTPAAASPDVVQGTDATTVTFYGRGYGHGIGMSQYGARGRALAGQLAPDILAHYYPGTTLGTVDPATPIRILVVSGFVPTATRPARVVGHGGPWTVDGIPGSWPAEGSATYTQAAGSTGAWQLTIADPNGTTLLVAPVGPSVRIRPASPATTIQVWFKPSYYDTYRGTIRLIGSSSGSISAIEETTLDTYLLGVVTCEMPASWPIEALKTQAIAARSFAAAHVHPTTGSWDVYDDTRSQVYRGVFGESPAAAAAVAATSGQVLFAGSSIAMTLFHSSDGGATENNENVYVSASGAVVGQPISYLRGSSDRAPDGTSYDATSPHASWQTATYTFAALSTVFGSDPRSSVGALSTIDLSDRGVSGRLIAVTLTGTLGTKTISGEVFRSIFNTDTPATDPYMWSTLVATVPLPDVCPPNPAAATAIAGVTLTLAGCLTGGATTPGATTNAPPAPIPTPTPTLTPTPTPTPAPTPLATPAATPTPPATPTPRPTQPVDPPPSFAPAIGSSPASILTVSVSAPVITWASPVVLTVRFDGGPGRPIVVQGTRDGVTWTSITTLVTGGDGTASLTYRPPTNLFYRAVFAGTADQPAVVSPVVRTVVRQITVLAGAGGRAQVVAATRPVLLSTVVRPSRPELTRPTVVYRISRYVAGRWTLVGVQSVVADPSGVAALTWLFGQAGTWSVVAAAVPTPYNANSVPTRPVIFVVR